MELNLSEADNWVCGWDRSCSTMTHLYLLSSSSRSPAFFCQLPLIHIQPREQEQEQPTIHSSMASVCPQVAIIKLQPKAYTPIVHILYDGFMYWISVIFSITTTLVKNVEDRESSLALKTDTCTHRVSGQHSY